MNAPAIDRATERRVFVVIPGTPVAQGRPRVSVHGGRPIVRDPRKSRDWKATAQSHMLEQLGYASALDGPAFPSGPLELHILARWPCPQSDHRKREPTPARWRDKRPDADNVGKAVKDAGSGVLWGDDSQVARLVVETITAAQGKPPAVVVKVRRLPGAAFPVDDPLAEERDAAL